MIRSTCTLLIVENFAPDRELYRRYLLADASFAYQLLEAESVAAGLELCQTQAIDAILLADSLPDADGLTFVEALHAQSNGNSPPVVVVGKRNETQAVKRGVEDYLVKCHLTPDRLRLTVRSAIENARLRLQLQQSEANLRDVIDRERIVHHITLQIRQSLDPITVLSTAVQEVRQFLAVDRVFIYRFNPDLSGTAVVESLGANVTSIANADIQATYFIETQGEHYCYKSIQIVENVQTTNLTDSHRAKLKQLNIRANLIVPIMQDEHLWGLLVLDQCDRPRQWQPLEIKLVGQLAAQIGIAIQQAELHQQVQTELSERQKTETQLRESQRFIEQIAQTVPGLIYLYDVIEQRNVYINRQVTEILGYTPEQVNGLGENVLESLFHPDDFARVPAHQAQFYTAPPESTFTFEYRIRHANGDWHWFYTKEIIYSRTPEGAPHYILGIAQEITDRKQIEIALFESERRFRGIFNTTYQFVGLLTPDGIVLEANQTALDFAGLTHEEAIGRPFWEARWWTISSETQQQLRDAIVEAAQGEFVRYEVEILGIGETTITIDFSLTPVRDESGQVVLIIPEGRDISDRIQNENRLRESEERLQLGVQIAGVALARIDYGSNTVTLSPEAAELYDIPADELITTRGRIHATFHPDEREMMEQIIAQEVDPAGSGWFAREHRIVRQNGEVRWLSVRKQIFFSRSGGVLRPEYGILAAIDITDRKQAEESLRQSEERYRSLSRLIPQLVWIAQPDGFMVDVNERWSAYTGLTLEEIQQQGWQAIVHPEDLPIVGAAWNAAQEEGHYYQAEGRKRRVDGVYRWHLFQAMPLKDKQGQITKWFGTSTDIHESKLIEAERTRLLTEAQAAREEAEAANRSKDEFVAMVAHELRSPLNTIAGWAALLKTRKFDEATTAKALDTISRNTQSQVQLVEDLLDITRIVRGTLQIALAPVNFVDVIEAVLDGVQPMADAKQIQLRTHLSGSARISGDFNRLQQIIVNLLTNAVKFTPPQGRINIELSKVDTQVRLVIRDTGKGIAAELLPVIFERYQQGQRTTGSKDGLGLGLAIVKHLVELHQGIIWVESKGEGQGTTFTVQFPLLDSDEGYDLNSGQSEAISLAGIRVLVVDDEPDQIELICIMLESYDAIVESATTAAAALEQFIQFTPDILVSDIAMPDTNGYQLLEQLRLEREVPALALLPEGNALSADASTTACDRSRQAGFQQHLTKPIEPEVLASVIFNLVRS